MTLFSLEAKTAIVTGGAAGIGAATVRRLSAAGARCVIADVAPADDLAAEVDGLSAVVDVVDGEAVDRLVSDTIAAFGSLDIMVNNAGVLGPAAGLLADAPDAARPMVEVNLMGVVNGIRAAGARMAPGSVIINMASMAGRVGFPGLAWYGTAKAGVVGLTAHAAVELGPRGIRVNCVCPTGVETEGFAPPELADHWAVRSQSLANQHVDRLARPEEVAAAVHYLASDDAVMVNGHALHVDGGLAAGPSIQLLEAATGRPITTTDGGIAE